MRDFVAWVAPLLETGHRVDEQQGVWCVWGARVCVVGCGSQNAGILSPIISPFTEQIR